MDKEKPHIFDFGHLFDGVRAPEREFLISEERIVPYGRNQVIFKEGARSRELFCLAKGRVKIYKQGFDRPQILRFLGPGDFFGYCGAFGEGPHVYNATAETMTEALLYSVSLSSLVRVAKQNNHVAVNLLCDSATQLNTITQRLVDITQKHLRGRVADMLLLLIRTYGRDLNSGVLRCVIQRKDMANIANMTVPNVIRTLHSFHDEGVIRISARSIAIIDEAALHRISAQG